MRLASLRGGGTDHSPEAPNSKRAVEAPKRLQSGAEGELGDVVSLALPGPPAGGKSKPPPSRLASRDAQAERAQVCPLCWQ